MRVCLLGSACSVPSAERDSNHYVVTTDQGAGAVLIDVAGSTYHHLLQVGIEPSSLAAVIVTHHHADHVAGFPAFAQSLRLLPQPIRLPVHAPPDTVEVLQALCERLGVPTDGESLTIDWHPIDLDSRSNHFEMGGVLEVSAIPSAHSLPCAALRFHELGTGTIVVSSSDSAYNPDLAPFADGADLLMHDCLGPAGEPVGNPPNHSTAEEVAQIANRCQPGAVLPMHLIDSLLPKTLATLRQQARCPVLPPNDKQWIHVSSVCTPRYSDPL